MAEDLTRWLEAAGLGELAPMLLEQAVDFDVLSDLSEADLKELGLSLGVRKRLLKAIAGLNGAGEGGAEAAPAPSPTPTPAPSPAPPPAPAAARAPSTPAKAAAAHGERRQLTVMFVDLIESSPLAERFDPEVMRAILARFHEACVAAIEAHEGHIAQYSGDGLLVYFGYPRAHEDDALRAVLAGFELISNLNRANDALHAEHGIRLQVRVGVETGLVVAGEVGAGSARDLQAIVGETPIIAARLQTLAPPDSLVVGPATERLIQGSFLTEDMGPQKLKGVSEAMRVHRVVARTEATGSFDVRAVRGLTPLIGRAAEIEMLRQRWRQACDGQMRAVLLTGEAGIGKSRMVRAFRDACGEEAQYVIVFQCAAQHKDSPFWPVLQRLQRALGLEVSAVVADDIERLEAGLDAFEVDAAEKAEAALILSNLFAMPTAGRYPPIDTSSPSFKRRTLNVLVELVASRTRKGPVLIVVEDVTWIDPSTLEFVRLTIERLADTPLLLVLTARPEFRPGWTYPQLVQLNLDRLSKRDRLEMIGSLADGKALPAAVAEQIVAKTDGVPLFVEELTKAVLAGGLLREADGRYELTGPLLEIAVPDTLQGSLLARLDRLEANVRSVAQIAATIGREFERALLALIAGKSEEAVGATLERLVAEEIILPAPGAARGEGAFVFRHGLIQEIAYQSLLLERRRHYHGLIAEAFEARYPDVVERRPELIAQNFAASEDPERALPYWRKAAERALANAAYEEAIAHARRGLDLAATLTLDDAARTAATLCLDLVLAEAQYRMGDARSIDTYRQAAATARREMLTAPLAQAALGFAQSAMYLGGSSYEAVALVGDALAAVGPSESVERSRLLSRYANVLHMDGRGEEATTRAAIALARRLGDEQGLLDALWCETMSTSMQPLPREAFAERRAVLEELAAVADRLGDHEWISGVRARSLCAYLEMGDVAAFEAALERMREVYAGVGMVQRWILVGSRAMAAMLSGDFAEAEKWSDETQRMAESVDATLSAGVNGMQMFTIRREQGRLAQVAPLIKRLVDENPEDETWRPGLMLIASDLGFEAPARRTFEAIAEGGFALPMDGKRLVTWTYLAEVAARLGDRGHVERVYESLVPYKDQAVTMPAFTLCCGSAGRWLGRLAGVLGDWAAAEAHFEEALAMNEAMRAWPWLAHARHEYAVMLLARNRRGDRARATQLIADAEKAAEEMGMFALQERIRGVDASAARKH